MHTYDTARSKREDEVKSHFVDGIEPTEISQVEYKILMLPVYFLESGTMTEQVTVTGK